MQRPHAKPASAGYQTMVVILLGINMGVVFLDRSAFGLLAPLIQPEFALTNTDIGLINGVLAATWSLSSFGLARLADLTRRRTTILVVATVIFSCASISSGLAVGLLSLIAARALMGLAEGGLPPVSMNIVASEVAPERRGLALGALSTIGLNAVPLLGPLVIVGIGATLGWRHAFWIAGVPGLIMAAVIWRLVREPPWHDAQTTEHRKGSILPLLAIHNIRIGIVLAACNMACIIILTGFLPLYLVQVAGLSAAMMGAVITATNAAMILFGFAGPMLSDRFGRKPVVLLFFLLTLPGCALVAQAGSSLPLLIAGTILSAAFSGVSILVMAAIAAESAPPHLAATAMGFNAAVGELIGAAIVPVIIGTIADRIGLAVLPWLFGGLALLAAGLTLALVETAPNRIRRLVPAT